MSIHLRKVFKVLWLLCKKLECHEIYSDYIITDSNSDLIKSQPDFIRKLNYDNHKNVTYENESIHTGINTQEKSMRQ